MWNGRIYNAPPDEEFKRLMKKLRDARTKTKIHQETCPNCGAKLVNLYRKSTEDSKWMCKKCWDKEEALKRLKIVEVNPEFKAAVDANDGYCPCAIWLDDDTKCMCKDFREQTEPGPCNCGRFEKVVKDENDTPRCKTCQVHAGALKSSEPAACAWYVENVVCGDKSVKSCPNYKPVEGE